MSNHRFIYITLIIFSVLILFYAKKSYETVSYDVQTTSGVILEVGNISDLVLEEEELVFLKPFVPLIDNVQLAIDYKIQGCAIGKAMSQLMFNTMCYLSKADVFANNNLTFNAIWYDDRGVCLNISTSYHTKEIESGEIKLSEYVKFAFVRDPLDRFRSFYIDKCINEKVCGDCKDVLCAAKSSYETLKKFMNTGESEEKAMYMAGHAAPQTWSCEFGRTLHDYKIIQIGASMEERTVAFGKLAELLRKGNVPEIHIERILKDALPADTAHATYNSDESQRVMEEIEKNQELRKYLHHMYYYDYIAFGFNMSALDESYRHIKRQ